MALLLESWIGAMIDTCASRRGQCEPPHDQEGSAEYSLAAGRDSPMHNLLDMSRQDGRQHLNEGMAGSTKQLRSDMAGKQVDAWAEQDCPVMASAVQL